MKKAIYTMILASTLLTSTGAFAKYRCDVYKDGELVMGEIGVQDKDLEEFLEAIASQNQNAKCKKVKE